MNKKEFNGRNALLKIKEEGLKRKLVGFTLPDRMLARHGNELLSNDQVIGHVTSGTFSPSLKVGIGMGYVSADLAHAGNVVLVPLRGKKIPATIVSLPFLKNH